MPSVNFTGPYTNYYSSLWHRESPRMAGSGTLTAYREGSTIIGSVYATSTMKSSTGFFGYPAWVYVYANGVAIASRQTAYGGTWSTSFDFSITTNDAVTFTVVYHCSNSENEWGSCSHGYNYVTMDGSVYIDSYNPWTDPSVPTTLSVSPANAKPDASVTVSWNRAYSGTGNTVTKYHLAFAKTNSSGGWVSSRVEINENISIDTTSMSVNVGNYINIRPRRYGKILS